jgi:hypothetical protein
VSAMTIGSTGQAASFAATSSASRLISLTACPLRHG